MKRLSRHAEAAKRGRRISRGEWERMNKAYAVYPHTHKLIIVDYERDEDGVPNLKRPLAGHPSTLVRLPDTPLHSRKVSMHDRFMTHTKRARFPEGKQAGIVR